MHTKQIIKKSDCDIVAYKKYGFKFGEFLNILREEISCGQLDSYDKVSNRFISLCKNEFSENKSIDFPFAKVKNFIGEEFGGAICVSVNDAVAHGKYDLPFRSGDLVSVDCGFSIKCSPFLYKQRPLHFDAGLTVAFKAATPAWVLIPGYALSKLKTLNCLDEKLTTMHISRVIESIAKEANLKVVVSNTGHGIGYSLHEFPYIHNALGSYSPVHLIDNSIICVEPIYVLPKEHDTDLVSRTYIDSDGWTVRTTDGQPGSHFEGMFCIENNKLVDLLGLYF